MSLERIGVTRAELSTLASACDRDADELSAVLHRRPWSLHDLLADPDIIRAIREPESIGDATSPFLLFAVLTRSAADELLDSTYVNDWIGPRSRLPVFDVEPLQEFVSAPGRVLFVARLLASMVDPPTAAIPIDGTDPWDLVDWLDTVEPADRVALLCRLGDLALFMAGVFADALGEETMDPARAGKFGRSVGMTGDEILALIDPASSSPGLDALEHLGARWYREAGRSATTVPLIVDDVARRIHSARRFLTHVADSYLAPLGHQWQFTY